MKPGILLASVFVAISLQLCTAVPFYDNYKWERPYIQQSQQEHRYIEAGPAVPSAVEEEEGPTEADAYAFPYYGPSFTQSGSNSVEDFKTLALNTGPKIVKSVRLITFEPGTVVEWEYITPNFDPTGKYYISLNFVLRSAPADGDTGIEKAFLHISIRGGQTALVLNTCAPWGNWANEERPTGYPLTPGMRVVTRVEALTDRFRISVPYANTFSYDFIYRTQYGDVSQINEIYVRERNTAATQKIVVGEIC